MSVVLKVKKAPTQPGVYLMKSKEDKIIYIGKAKNLRNRLKSYFQSKDHTARIQTLVNRIHDIQWILTDTELEALILECTLIKKHKPRYNVHLRDDKSYPYLRISVQEKWPQISIVRKPKRDAAHYFGPYTSAYSIREVLRLLTKVFPIRDCSKAKFSNRSRPCLSYDMGICTAPCVGYVSEQDYRKTVNDLILFLKGKNKKPTQFFEGQMKNLAREERFEEAARLRDRLFAIQDLLEKQKMVSLSQKNQDVIGMVRFENDIDISILFIRMGRLLGKKTFTFSNLIESDPVFLEKFLTQYYEEEFIPDEIIVPQVPKDKVLLEKFLGQIKKVPIKIIWPQKGGNKSILDLAIQNAKATHIGRRAMKPSAVEISKSEAVLKMLQQRFHLKNDPYRMECFDISNIQGTYAVGSRVTFMAGQPDKNLYRRYKIQSVKGPDDFAMMVEVLARRFQGKDKDTLPDLLVIDGGKGQLSVALRVLKDLEIENVDVFALAKEKTFKSQKGKMIEKREERVYLPGQKNPIVLRQNSPILYLLQRLRDEAHRFAITYHKKLRQKGFIPR